MWEEQQGKKQHQLAQRLWEPDVNSMRELAQFSHIYIHTEISSHCENRFENRVGIQEPPNTGNNPGSSLLKF